ncbi:MAG: hypothetical protein AB7O46_03610 [Xanthobacteraceae bacterium]
MPIRTESIRAIRGLSIRRFRLATLSRRFKKTNLLAGRETQIISRRLREASTMRAEDRVAVTALMEAKTFELRDTAAKAQAEALAAGRQREALSWAARLRSMDQRIEKFGLQRREIPKEILDRARNVIYRSVSQGL